jgi:dolichol-phosphate mannosyltransferase
LTVLQAASAAVVLTRLARGRRRRPPLRAGGWPDPARRPRISVVIPARDEAARIGPCLEGLAGDPDVDEVLVVDDRSTDATAEVAAAAGARVIDGLEPPEGWVGKPWALQQGLLAASGDVVVSLDADTRPRPGLAGALARALEEADLVTCSARFVCEQPLERALHAAMLATLVYRFGPADAAASPSADRLISNGQCTAVRREPLLAAGGYGHAAGHMTDDAAFARALARMGRRVVFRDGTAMLDVKMHDSPGETWREWGRSIALADVTSPARQATDLLVTWTTLALPVLRLLAGRPTRLDVGLLALRVTLLGALKDVYATRGAAFWASPLADPAAVVRLSLSALRPARVWRGRRYPAEAGPARTSPR